MLLTYEFSIIVVEQVGIEPTPSVFQTDAMTSSATVPFCVLGGTRTHGILLPDSVIGPLP